MKTRLWFLWLSFALGVVSARAGTTYSGSLASITVTLTAATTIRLDWAVSGTATGGGGGTGSEVDMYSTTGNNAAVGSNLFSKGSTTEKQFGRPLSGSTTMSVVAGNWYAFRVYATQTNVGAWTLETTGYFQISSGTSGTSASKANVYTPGVNGVTTLYVFTNPAGTVVSRGVAPGLTNPTFVVPNPTAENITVSVFTGVAANGIDQADWTPTGSLLYQGSATLQGSDAIGSGVAGPAGPAGAVGATGPAGATGATGAQGATGPAGPPGATGATGPAGAASTVPGPKGDQGLRGFTGATGDTGAASTVAGPQGEQGPAGLNGTNGLDGAPGIGGEGGAGADGGMGGPGGAGGAGGAGGVGINGRDGLDGAEGPQGIQGIQGIRGLQGEMGAQGEPGVGVDLTNLTAAVNTLHTDNADTATSLATWRNELRQNRVDDKAEVTAAKDAANTSGTSRATGASNEWGALVSDATGAASSFQSNAFVAGSQTAFATSPMLGDNGYARTAHEVSGMGPLLVGFNDSNPLTSSFLSKSMPTGTALAFCDWVRHFIEWAIVIAFLIWMLNEVREHCFILGMTPRQQIGGSTEIVLHTSVVGNSVGVIPAGGMYAAGIVISSTLLLSAPVILVAAFADTGGVAALKASQAATAANGAGTPVANILSYVYVVLPVATMITAFLNAGLVKMTGIMQWVMLTVAFRLFQL